MAILRTTCSQTRATLDVTGLTDSKIAEGRQAGGVPGAVGRSSPHPTVVGYRWMLLANSILEDELLKSKDKVFLLGIVMDMLFKEVAKSS